LIFKLKLIRCFPSL